MSFVADILVLTVYGDTWAVEKHAYAFSMSIIICNLFVKAVALLVIILIYGELGNSRLPLHYHYQQAHAQQQQQLLHTAQQQHTYTMHRAAGEHEDGEEYSRAGLNDSSIVGLNDTSIANDEGLHVYGGGQGGRGGGEAGYGMHGGPIAYPVDPLLYGSGYQTEGISSRTSV